LRRLPHRLRWLALALGLAAAIVWGSLGVPGSDRGPGPDASSVDTGNVSLAGAGLLAESERTRTKERPRDVVKADPPVSMDPAGPGEVVGQVVDPEGRAVVAIVSLYLDGAGYGPHFFATTDAAGRFRIRLRSVGSEGWTGVVALVRPRGWTAPLTPTRAGAAPLRIVATRARETRITVVDEAGVGVGIARVRVGHSIYQPSAGPSRPWIDRVEEIAARSAQDTYTDRSGVAVVMQLPTPASVVTVASPLDRDLLPTTLVGWDGGDATVRLTAKPRVEGTVREIEGGLLTDGKVWWRRSGTKEWKEVRIEYDGTFSIDCGEPGAIELCPRMFNAFPRVPVATRVVPSGATNVALLTAAGPTLDVRLDGWVEEAMGTAELIREPADAEDAPRISVKVDDGRVRVRGLDATATYTLWVPPASRVSASPMPTEPDSLCVLRPGLKASGEPVTVALAPAHGVEVRFAVEGQRQPWQRTRITARGHGTLLDLTFGQEWRYDEYEGKAWIRLPAGPFRIRVESAVLASTDADLQADRILVLPHAGEADWVTGAERVEVRMVPSADGPRPYRGD